MVSELDVRVPLILVIIITPLLYFLLGTITSTLLIVTVLLLILVLYYDYVREKLDVETYTLISDIRTYVIDILNKKGYEFCGIDVEINKKKKSVNIYIYGDYDENLTNILEKSLKEEYSEYNFNISFIF